jgi:hypothetical protein
VLSIEGAYAHSACGRSFFFSVRSYGRKSSNAELPRSQIQAIKAEDMNTTLISDNVGRRAALPG